MAKAKKEETVNYAGGKQKKHFQLLNGHNFFLVLNLKLLSCLKFKIRMLGDRKNCLIPELYIQPQQLP